MAVDRSRTRHPRPAPYATTSPGKNKTFKARKEVSWDPSVDKPESQPTAMPEAIPGILQKQQKSLCIS